MKAKPNLYQLVGSRNTIKHESYCLEETFIEHFYYGKAHFSGEEMRNLADCVLDYYMLAELRIRFKGAGRQWI